MTHNAVKNQNPILSDFRVCVLYATESSPTAMPMLSTHTNTEAIKFLLPFYR